jgi:hypothetical protein
MKDPDMSQAQLLESIEVQLSFSKMIPGSALQALEAIAIVLEAYKFSQSLNRPSELAS